MPLKNITNANFHEADQTIKSRILVVDDDPTQLRFYLHGLKDQYHCHFAKTANEALIRARQFPQPDLILLDVLIPILNGFEICRMLKEDPLTAKIPVIFASGQGNSESKVKGFSLGCVDYITKPIIIPEMKARISTHLKLTRQTRMLESLAYIDPLTEVANRRKYNETMQREWLRSIRYGQQITMLLMDIDFFRQFNDFYGHGVGDNCLVRLSHCLDSLNLRSGDLFARIGGEEFVMLLNDCDKEGAVNKAKEVLESVALLNIANQGAPNHDRVTLSIGVATIRPRVGEEPIALFQAADAALYRAKQTGKNKYVLAQGTSSQANNVG